VTAHAARRPTRRTERLSDLRNVGPAAVADLAVLGIETVAQLRTRDPDALVAELEARTLARHDPCVRDVFAAAIHQARTGEALDWWRLTPLRKTRAR
jgi:hypothetical protein